MFKYAAITLFLSLTSLTMLHVAMRNIEEHIILNCGIC